MFGVPATHEDDPSAPSGRASRSARRPSAQASATPLRLRVGINTGEALVRLDVAPESGERFMTGDAINTASRIQSVAPEMGVAVGEATCEATRAAVRVRGAAAGDLKGKAEPVRVFHATVAARPPRRATSCGPTAAPTSGGTSSSRCLRGIFDGASPASSAQLVIVIGEPGIGKSRLVAELRRRVDGRARARDWRQGRCLPYGDGITFWALGEIVKAHAGILESRRPGDRDGQARRGRAQGAERDWMRASGCCRSSASDGRPAAGRAGGVRGLAAVPRQPRRREGPRSSCSRTSTGRTTRCSTSWRSSRRAEACRCSSSARPARSCFGRAGAAARARELERIDLAPLSDEDDRAAIVADLLGVRVPAELRGPIARARRRATRCSPRSTCGC